jgi:uncharacterized membrane protein (DUF373 family)
MENFIKLFEKYVSWILVIIAMVFICYQICDLVYHTGARIIETVQNGTFNIEQQGSPIASVFFSVLLILEVIQTIMVFSSNHIVKVKVILIVGLIAVTRKILLSDIAEADPKEEFAIATLILALSASYFLVSRSEKDPDKTW